MHKRRGIVVLAVMIVLATMTMLPAASLLSDDEAESRTRTAWFASLLN